MTFQSGITAAGSRSYYTLIYVVAIVLVACVSMFLGVLALEVWRSLRFAKRVDKHRRRSRVASVLGSSSTFALASGTSSSASSDRNRRHSSMPGWMSNPLMSRSSRTPLATAPLLPLTTSAALENSGNQPESEVSRSVNPSPSHSQTTVGNAHDGCDLRVEDTTAVERPSTGTGGPQLSRAMLTALHTFRSTAAITAGGGPSRGATS
jgi:hypothetical protein